MIKKNNSSKSLSNIGIVGLGSIGKRHMRLLKQEFPDIKLIGIRSRPNSQKPELINKQVDSISKAIEIGIQACIISTPAVNHIEQAIELSSNGIHLMIEKPLSNNFDGIESLRSKIAEEKIVALVGYNLRHNESAIYFKKLLETKKIGELIHVNCVASSFLPDWRPKQNYLESVSASKDLGGGVLLELSHEFDYLRWFFGDIQTVICEASQDGVLNLDVEESVDMVLKSEKGLQITLHLDFNQRLSRRFCEIHGTDGVLKWDAKNNSVTHKNNKGEEERISFNTDRDHMYSRQLIHFIDCINMKCEPDVTFNDGVQALKIALAAKKSSKNGKKEYIQ